MSTIVKDKRPSVKEITATLSTGGSGSKDSNSQHQDKDNSGNGIKKLLSLWRDIENQGEKEAKETQKYNERKLKQSGRQYSYLANSKKRNFAYMNLSDSTKRQSSIGSSGRKYDRFGNIVTPESEGAQKQTLANTGVGRRVPLRESSETHLIKEEDVPIHVDSDDEEVPIDFAKRKKIEEEEEKKENEKEEEKENEEQVDSEKKEEKTEDIKEEENIEEKKEIVEEVLPIEEKTEDVKKEEVVEEETPIEEKIEDVKEEDKIEEKKEEIIEVETPIEEKTEDVKKEEVVEEETPIEEKIEDVKEEDKIEEKKEEIIEVETPIEEKTEEIVEEVLPTEELEKEDEEEKDLEEKKEEFEEEQIIEEAIEKDEEKEEVNIEEELTTEESEREEDNIEEEKTEESQESQESQIEEEIKKDERSEESREETKIEAEVEKESKDETEQSDKQSKKKKRRERKSVNLDENQDEKCDDDEKKKKRRKRKSVETTSIEQEPPMFSQESEDEPHRKQKKRKSRSSSKVDEREEKDLEAEEVPLVMEDVIAEVRAIEQEPPIFAQESEDEPHRKQKKRKSRSSSKVDEREEKEEAVPTVAEDAMGEEGKDDDRKRRRHHSKTKSQDETSSHRHKRRSSSMNREKEDKEEKEEKKEDEEDEEKLTKSDEANDDKDKKRRKKKSSTLRENTRKLSLGDEDEKKSDVPVEGNTNESWKKKKAWATLGANDINKPFSEMTPEDKAIMRGKYETEIVETESDYIDKLRLIKELYMAPLVALTKTGNEKNAIITATQITHIFSNLDIILNYNTILYKQMREWKEKVDEEKAAAAAAAAAASKKKKKDKEEPARRDSEGDCPRAKSLGSIFLTLTDFLKTYISYCNNYPRALETISELKEKNKRFVDFINERQLNERSEGLNLNMLIIMPIQRIPRYVLLLKDVLRYTLEDDPDYEKLTRALDKMKGVADDLNKKKKDAEDRDLLREIEKKLIFSSSGNYGDFDSLLSVQSRRYIGEGDGTVICSTVEKGKAKNMHIFLFNDIICFTKPSISGGKYKVIELFKIIDSEITMQSPAAARKEIPALPAAVSSALPVEEIICFSSTEEESTVKPFAFYAEDAGTTKKWFADLVNSQEAIKKSVQTFKDAVVRANITPTL